MLRLILLFAFAALPNVAPTKPRNETEVSERLAQAQPTRIEQFPYTLSLQVQNRHLCGAAILTAYRAVTAARCVEGQHPYNVKVRASSTYSESGGQLVGVSNFATHPRFTPGQIDFDVSVLYLTEPIRFGGGAAPIPLGPRGYEVPVGQSVTVTGWGAEYSGGPMSAVLKVINVPRTTDYECHNAYPNLIKDHKMCCGFAQGGPDMCSGDAGDPAAFAGQLYGVASFGEGCGSIPGKTGVYTKATHPEIHDHISRHMH